MPRAVALPAAERRSLAVQALLELAAETAPDQISTAAIALRMGTSHAALFRHFPSRDALWAESVRWATGQLDQQFAALAAEDWTDPLRQAEQLLLLKADFVRQHPGLLRMWFAELQRPRTSPAREEAKAFMGRLRQRLTALLVSAGERGLLRSSLPAAELAQVLMACCEGLMLQGLVHDSLSELTSRTREALPLLLPRVPG
ncbi:MAG: TetR/AcrR family transcriptional regulator [Cyanobium sp.]